MEVENIMRLVQAVSASGISEFDFSEGNITIHMAKGAAGNELSSKSSHAADTAAGEELSFGTDTGGQICSPLVGTFYTAPAEDAPSFVKVGDPVKKGQVLAIVEAMKLMNEIESDMDGTVTAVLAANGEPVEYGQPLFAIS